MVPSIKNSNHPAVGESIRVEPIRNLEDIKALKKLLAGNPRDLAILTVGINSSLHCCDLLELKIGDVRNVQIGDQLRGKINMNPAVYNVVQKLLASFPTEYSGDDMNLIQSHRVKGFPLTSPTLSNMVKRWCRDAGIRGKFSAESLRKTFGYHQLITFGVDVRTVMGQFNLVSTKRLLSYIGIQASELKKPYPNEL